MRLGEVVPAAASSASSFADISILSGDGMSRQHGAEKRVAILISGRGSNMVALIEAAKAGDYPAEIVLVVSNRPDAPGLAYARDAGIATAIVDQAVRQRSRGVRAALDARA